MKIEPTTGCIATALEVVGDKWSPLILRDLADSRRRFSQLEHSLTGISPRTLSQRLERLAEQGIITKHCYSEMPPRVEYELTKRGQDLIPILQAMSDWGAKHAPLPSS